ncbi:MAG: hypothetical protein AMJ88_17940 [Anaerolineae bacterium SM23_ 63]|nr:MAG: hypothetical protein AMJ88_17940 [Anaerolineae bacterium SM23_ 63]
MDEKGFIEFMRKNRRSENAIKRCVEFIKTFESYLTNFKAGKTLEAASPEDLEGFAVWGEDEFESINKHLWGIGYYYEYISNPTMRKVAGELRKKKIKRRPLALKKFVGVNPEHIEKLLAIGIKDVQEMLQAGRTKIDREALSKKSGVPLDGIVELVKLSDLARIPGVKDIRARLYYEAGVDSIEKLSAWEPEELRAMLVNFVEETSFEGIAPWLKEAEFTVEFARKLPRIVEY